MIIRTYQRRNKSGRSSLSDSGGNLYGDGVGSSGSQESLWGSSQEPAPFAFPSSQESCWSQSDYGNSTRSFKSSRRESHDDDPYDDNKPSLSSRPPISRSYSERPPLNSERRSEEQKFSRGKLRNTEGVNGTKTSSSQVVDRSRFSETYDKDGLANGASSSKTKRGPLWVDAFNNASLWGIAAPPTSTLMEAQESGEMMEHVDEANFALDGLRSGQPVRIQRASLSSLLSLCGSMQRRRMLKTHGMAKPLLDAIVALPTDDPPIALAAAAVLYFLASDSQDEDLLDSEPCVLFLMRLLGTCPSQPVVKKGLSAIGSRLAALSKSTLCKSSAGNVDRGAAVVRKVHDLFKSLPKHGLEAGGPSEGNGILLGEEINSKCLALLTLEKACISTVVLEDSTAETVRKVGGRFKERLRELGGLDAVCELAASCLVNLMDALKTEDTDGVVDVDLAHLEKNEKSGGVGVLLRCMRVMENVTFLSEQNQKHLLELKLSRGKLIGTQSFIGLTINAISTLSELAQMQKEKMESLALQKVKGRRPLAERLSGTDKPYANGKHEPEKLEPSASGKNTSSVITFQRRKTLKLLQQKADSSERSQGTSVISGNSRDTQSGVGNSGKMETSCFKRKMPASKSETSQKSITGPEEHKFSKQTSGGSDWKAKKSRGSLSFLEDSQDPFVCDVKRGVKNNNNEESDLEESQNPFDFGGTEFDLKTDKKPKRGQPGKLVTQQKGLGVQSRLQPVQEHGPVPEISDFVGGSEILGREDPEGQDEASKQGTLLGDCLLSGVKVLMNLTNGNPVGCSQVATCGGLDSLSALLIAHYPWPRSYFPLSSDTLEDDRRRSQEVGQSPNRQCGGNVEQDLDLLVTVLGVLCNLVEKDISNRALLASLKVVVPPDITSTREGKLWQESGMIGLLCSLFLTKQGAGEAAEAIETKRALEMDEEVRQGQAEAEDMIVEAYTALLLAFLSKESERARSGIATLLPGDDLRVLVPVLERFLAFHLSLNMISGETHTVVLDVIESCKRPISVRPVT